MNIREHTQASTDRKARPFTRSFTLADHDNRAIHNLEYQVSNDDGPTAPGIQAGNSSASTHRQLTMAEALALDTLNTSLAIQERNQYGGFWCVCLHIPCLISQFVHAGRLAISPHHHQ